MTERRKSSSEDDAAREAQRLEEARRVIEEYANDLRKILDQLRRKLN